MKTIKLNVIKHDKIYVSIHLASFEDGEEIKGDLSFEGPYLTIRAGTKRASVQTEEFIEKLLEAAE